MTLKLKPPGTERLKLQCDDPLSNFTFSFNLRRYTVCKTHMDIPDDMPRILAKVGLE